MERNRNIQRRNGMKVHLKESKGRKKKKGRERERKEGKEREKGRTKIDYNS